MSQPPTTLNPDEAPVFDTPVPADLPRRTMDRRLLESIDADHRRSREHSSRLTRLESLHEQIARDLAKLEQQQRESLGWQEQTASSMAAISNKLSVHTEMEEYQWRVVNESHKHLEELSAALAEHLAQAGSVATRIDWLERVLFGLCGAITTLLVSWVVMRLEG